MRHYNVSGVSGRRVNIDDGTVEYRVQWEGYDGLCNTWEPRSTLFPRCAGAVGEVDAHEETAMLRCVESWKKSCEPSKRARELIPAVETSPSLHGIIVHSRPCGSGEEERRDVTSLVGLGERVISDATSHELNPSKKKKKVHSHSEHELPCDPALLLEKCWWDKHAVSFMHDCVSSKHHTPAVLQFELGTGSDTCRDASKIDIHSIAPAALVKSGQTYGTPTSCEPLIGREEVGRLRSQCSFNTVLAQKTQALVRGKRDQLVVRYFLAETTDERDRTLFTMPLSVFRRYYPQLLLDFLLRHTLVMESS